MKGFLLFVLVCQCFQPIRNSNLAASIQPTQTLMGCLFISQFTRLQIHLVWSSFQSILTWMEGRNCEGLQSSNKRSVSCKGRTVGILEGQKDMLQPNEYFALMQIKFACWRTFLVYTAFGMESELYLVSSYKYEPL